MKTKKLPTFKTLAEEKTFWENHDSTEYIDWTKAKPAIFSNLKPSTVTISLRLPKMLFEKIRQIANKNYVPYQSFIKMILGESVYGKHAAAKKTKS